MELYELTKMIDHQFQHTRFSTQPLSNIEFEPFWVDVLTFQNKEREVNLEQRDFLNDCSDSISFTVQFNITKLVKKLKYGISLALFSSNQIVTDLRKRFDENWLLESLLKLLLAELRLKMDSNIFTLMGTYSSA